MKAWSLGLLLVVLVPGVSAGQSVSRASIWAAWRELYSASPSEAVRDSMVALIRSAPADLKDSLRAQLVARSDRKQYAAAAAAHALNHDSVRTTGYACKWPRRTPPDSVRYSQSVQVGDDVCRALELAGRHPDGTNRYASPAGEFLIWRNAGAYDRITFRWDGKRWRVLTVWGSQ